MTNPRILVAVLLMAAAVSAQQPFFGRCPDRVAMTDFDLKRVSVPTIEYSFLFVSFFFLITLWSSIVIVHEISDFYFASFFRNISKTAETILIKKKVHKEKQRGCPLLGANRYTHIYISYICVYILFLLVNKQLCYSRQNKNF